LPTCQAKPRKHKRKNKVSKVGESDWLRKRRKLVSKAVAGSSTVAAEAQGAASLSRGLWCDKQKKERTLQKQRDHVNRSLLACPAC